jgi:predicted RNase H-like HicB family nuclease
MQESAPMKLSVELHRDEDGMWVAEIPAVPGCVSQGRTRDEALANVREAAEGCLLVRAESGLPLTVETTEIEVHI